MRGRNEWPISGVQLLEGQNKDRSYSRTAPVPLPSSMWTTKSLTSRRFRSNSVTLCASHTSPPGDVDPLIREVEVSRGYKTVRLHAVILRDKSGGTPVISKDEVAADAVAAGQRLAQAGIKVRLDPDDITVIDPPNGVNLNDGLDPLRDVENKEGEFSTKSEPSAEVDRLLSTRNAKLARQDVYVFYVNHFTGNPGMLGSALATNTTRFSSDASTILISATNRISYATLGHELGHTLLVAEHDMRMPTHLMADGNSVRPTNTVDASKRLTEDQAVQSLRTRPSNC